MSFYGSPPLAAAASDSLVRFGHRTRPVESSLNATTAAQRLFQNNPNRVEFTVVNLGTQNVFIGLGNQVSSTFGMLIPPNGGLTMLVEEDGETVGYDWNVAASSGSQPLYMLEVLAD